MLAASWRATKWLYRIFIVLLVFAALYLAVSSWLLPQIDKASPRLEQYLSNRLNMPVAIDQIEARMDGFTPVIDVLGMQAGLGLYVERATIKPDLLSVLTTGRFQMQQLQMEGVWLQFSEINGRFRIPGSNPVQANTSGIGINNRRILDLVYSLGSVDFNDVNIVVSPSFSGEFLFTVPTVSIAANDDERFVVAELEVGDAEHQTTAEFRLNMERGLRASSAQGYLSIDEVVLNELSDLIPSESIIPGDIRLDGEFWFSIRNDRLTDWHANLLWPKLNWQHINGKEISGDNTNLLMQWRRQAQGWQLSVNSESEQLNLPQWVQVNSRNNTTLEILSDSLDLATANDLVSSIAPIDLLVNLAPTGTVESPRVLLTQPDSFEFMGQLSNASIEPYKGIPGGNGLSGDIWTNGYYGRLNLAAAQSELYISNLFEAPWQAQSMSGDFGWWMHDRMLNLTGKNVLIAQQDKTITGAMGLKASIGGDREPRLSLVVNTDGASTADLPLFIPKLSNLAGARDWLTNRVQQVEASKGQFVMSVPINRSRQQNRQNFWLDFEIDQASVRYLDDWPVARNASGRLFVTPESTIVNIDDASWQQLDGLSGKVTVAHQQAQLAVQVEADDKLPLLYESLLDSPLKEQLGSELASWQLDGSAQLSLGIGVPLRQASNFTVGANLALQGANLNIPNQRLRIQDVEGQLTFNLAQGIGGDLSGRLFGGLVQAELTPSFANDQVISIAANGSAHLPEVGEWLGLPLLDELVGRSSYTGALTIAEGVVDLDIASSLIGSALDWPEPLNKTAAEAWPLALHFQSGDTSYVSASIEEKLDAEVHFSADKLNGAIAYQQLLPDQLPDEGIAILATTDNVDAQLWWQWAADRFMSGNETEGKNPVSEIIINANAAQFSGLNISQPRLVLRHAESRWTADLRSQEIVGLIGISDDPQAPLQVSLSLLNIDLADGDSDEKTDPLAAIDPTILPAMQVEIQRLAIDGNDYGSWRGELVPEEKGVRLSGLSGVMRGIEVLGSADWQGVGDNAQSHAKLRLRTTSVADALVAFEQPRLVDSSSALMNVDFTWQGSPLALKFTDVVGVVDFEMLAGTIYDVDSIEGLKLFGLLNMTRVLSRLALDFSDIIGPGLAYDQIAGDIVFANGYASVGEALTFDSSSVFIAFDGGVNLITEQLDADAEVSIPITSAIPVAVFLAGVSPQVAGLLFVTERIINEQLIRRAWIRYLLTGDLNNIKFQVYPARVDD